MYWLFLEHGLPDEVIRAGLAAGWECDPARVLLAADAEAGVLALGPRVEVAATITDLPPGDLRQVVDVVGTRTGYDLSVADVVERCQRFAAATGARVCTDAGYEPDGVVVVEPTGQCRHAALDVDVLGPDSAEPARLITSGGREHVGYLATMEPLDMLGLMPLVASHLALGAAQLSIHQCRAGPPGDTSHDSAGAETVERFAHVYSLIATYGRPWFPDSEDAENLLRAATAVARDLGVPMLVGHSRFDEQVVNIPGGSDSNQWAVVVGEGPPRRIQIKWARASWL
jgi:hypothetical protein